MSWALRSQALLETTKGGVTTPQAVDGALSFSGSLLKNTSFSLAGVLSFSGALLKQINFNLSSVLSFSGLLASSKLFVKSLYGILFLNKKVADDFNREDSTNLGPSWSEDYGDWKIANQRLELIGAADGVYKLRWSSPSISSTDYAVETTVVPKNTGDTIGVAARLSSSSGSANVTGYGLFAQSTTWQLNRYSGGTGFFIDSGAFSFNLDTPYILRLEVQGTNLRCYIDGVLKTSVIDANISSGDPGLLYNEFLAITPNGYYEDWSAYNLADDSLVKRVNKLLSASSNFSAVLLKNAGVRLYGTLALSGNVVKALVRGISGTLSFAGALVKQPDKVLAGALTFSGSLSRQTVKILTSVLSFSGQLIKVIFKSLAGVLNFTGLLQTTKVFLKDVTGALSFSGALLKQTSKPLSASLSFVGDLVRQTFKKLDGLLNFSGELLKSIASVKSGTLTFSGNLTKQINKLLSGTLNFSGTLLRSALKDLSGNISFNGSLIKQIGKILSGGLSFSGALQAVKAFLKALAGTLTFGGALVKSTRVSPFGLLTFLGTLTKLTSISKSGNLSFGGALLKRVGKLLSGTLTFAGDLVAELGAQQFQQAVGGALTFIGTIRRDVSYRGLVGALSFMGNLVRSTAHRLSGTLTFSGALTALRIVLKAVGGVLSFSGALVTFPTKSLVGTIAPSGSLVKAITRGLSGILEFVGNLAALFQPHVFVSAIGTVSTATLAAVPQSSISFAGSAVSNPSFSARPTSSVEFV